MKHCNTPVYLQSYYNLGLWVVTGSTSRNQQWIGLLQQHREHLVFRLRLAANLLLIAAM